MRFLVFTLYAPMGSFGEVAVGERRLSWGRPGRSAILGLVAAALGVKRTNDQAHSDLDCGLHYAVRTDAPGQPFLDYHTTQTPSARRGKTFATRREELQSGNLNTVLSTREWRTDACFTVALWPRKGREINLGLIADALRKPHFHLYVGRKSAPLGLPLNPELIEAESFIAALGKRRYTSEEETTLQSICHSGEDHRVVAFDHDAPNAPEDARVERRRDAVLSRVRWQFADRLEGVVVSAGEES